jgi:hypothetical protein
MDETDWYTRACLCGDWDSSTGWSAVFVNQWVKTALLRNNYTQVDTIWYEPYVSGMVSALNRGDTVFSYRGYWGMSGWSNSNAETLNNGWKMPFCVNITCDTGSFASGTSYSEGFLKAGYVSGENVYPAGGVGSIGTATIGTHTRYNNCMHYGIFQGLLYEQAYEMGAALTRGKMEMYLNYQANDPTHVQIWSHWNNLMGDPACETWTAVPQPLNVSYPATVYQGANSFIATVTAGPIPLPNALVCIKRDGAVYETGYTDAAGQVELPLAAVSNGEVLVTVTRHNYQPHLGSFTISDPVLLVGYQSSTIDDDGTGTSDGNGDGAVNPNESIELNVQLKNFGYITASNVTAELTTDDPFVVITDGEESFGTIGGGASAWCADDFDFDLDPGCPEGHIIRFGIDATDGANDWHSMLELPVVSSELEAVDYTLYDVGNSVLDPGETGQISIALRNNGSVPATGAQAVLVSLSPKVGVTDPTAIYGSINTGATVENTSDRFGLTAAADTYDGYQAQLLVVSTFSGGRRDTSFVSLTIGTRNSTDPIGPDNYGYWAFDNTDTSYPEAPTYNWIEIDPSYGGDGTALPLNDSGEYDDKTVTIDLPFDFTYYGDTYQRASVCSNGWMSMGSTYIVNYRNWTIPGAGSPNAMIAPFWDDLYSTNNKIFQWYDSANHRFIVEWSRVRNRSGGSYETFEVILYDPAHYPTETGDGEIVFQYETVNNVDNENYATTGIENYDHTDGLLYTFWNDYPAGAATLAAGRAIRFLPVVDSPTGTVAGTVRNDYNNDPIQNVTITVVEEGDTFVTGPDGSYLGTTAPGTYTVAAAHPSFEPDTAYGVVVLENEQVQVDFYLTDIGGPLLTTAQHPDTSDPNGPYVIPVTIEEYSGVAEAALYYKAGGPDFTAVPLTHLSGNEYTGEIPGQAYGSFVQYYVYARDNLGFESYDPADAPDSSYSFFVLQTIQLFVDDMETDQGWTVGAAGDDAATGIWERVDPNGTDDGGGTQVQPEDDHTPNPGVACYVTGNAAVGGGQGDNDVDNGTTTLLSPVFDFSGQIGEITLTYYRWYSNDTGSSTNDNWVVQITDDGSQWEYLENLSSSDRNWTLMEFNLGDYIDFTSQVQLRFVASDLGDQGIVEAAIDDLEITIVGTAGAPGAETQAPAFSLYQNNPNPASAATTIRFALGEDGPVTLVVYDIQGRVLRKLLDGPRTAGMQSIVWDGLDGSGHSVPSGIYFYRLQAGTRSDTRKMIFLK